MVHLHSFAPINKEKGILRWGLCPHAPGIYRFTARIAGLLGAAGAAPLGQYATNMNFFLVTAIGGRV